MNWDPVDQTVLANEQVIDGPRLALGSAGRAARTLPVVFENHELFSRFASALDRLDRWPEKVRLMQKNWIGRSEGLLIRFALDPAANPTAENELEIFTTRPDTLFGANSWPSHRTTGLPQGGRGEK